MKETIVTGRKFRRLADEAQNLWQRISFWTKASDLEFEDGKTAEAKLGEIDGITSDLSGEDTRIAASIKAVNSVDNKFGGVSQFIVDKETGKITGYTTDVGGADTVYPFKGILSEEFKVLSSIYIPPDRSYAKVNTLNATLEEDCNVLFVSTVECTNYTSVDIINNWGLTRDGKRYGRATSTDDLNNINVKKVYEWKSANPFFSNGDLYGIVTLFVLLENCKKGDILNIQLDPYLNNTYAQYSWICKI